MALFGTLSVLRCPLGGSGAAQSSARDRPKHDFQAKNWFVLVHVMLFCFFEMFVLIEVGFISGLQAPRFFFSVANFCHTVALVGRDRSVIRPRGAYVWERRVRSDGSPARDVLCPLPRDVGPPR